MQNLWAEDTNHEMAEESGASAGRAADQAMSSRPPDAKRRTQSIRESGNRDTVLSALRAWLLSDYIAPYCRSLAATRIFRRCYLIDALGGTRKTGKDVGTRFIASTSSAEALTLNIFDDLTEGALSEKPQKQAHSLSIPPILQPIVSLAQELAGESKPITLQGMILEGGKNKAKSADRPFALPKASALVSANWREIAPALLPAIEQFAAIFLLNPISPTSQRHEVPFFTYDDLVPFYQRTAPTELCLLIAHKHIENRLLPALHTPPGAAAFTYLLRSDRWKTLLAKDDNIAKTINNVIDLFQAAMQPHFLAVQRIAFPMLLGPASIEDTPYTLLFATRRQDSLVCMNDAVCSYRRRLEEQSHRGLLNEAWFREQQRARHEAALQHLKEDTLRRGRAQSPRRWPDLRQQLLIAHFGQWLQRDYDEIILNLLQTGELRCDWKHPATAAGGGIVGAPLAGALSSEVAAALSRVPGNEDTLLWSEKKKRY